MIKTHHSHLLLTLLTTIALHGCSTISSDYPATPTLQVVASAQMGEAHHLLNICRPKSVIRFAEKPDLYVNGKLLSEIPNGSRIIIPVKTGDEFLLKTSKNELLHRYKEDVLITGSISNDSLYILVRADANPEQAGTIALYGGIAEGLRQHRNEGPSKNWKTRNLNKDEFMSICGDLNKK